MSHVDTTLDTALGAPFEKLSIFYPMWNEEEYIERALIAGRRACERLVATGDIGDYELIVVDDASTDRTPQLADEFAAADPRVVVVHHERNRKLGGAMKTGFATASGDLVLYTDADLPFDMSELPRAVRLLREYDADIVSAYRFDRTGEGYLRSVYTFVYNLLIRTLFDVKARDINFAFKLCRARIFEHVELRSDLRRARDASTALAQKAACERFCKCMAAVTATTGLCLRFEPKAPASAICLCTRRTPLSGSPPRCPLTARFH